MVKPSAVLPSAVHSHLGRLFFLGPKDRPLYDARILVGHQRDR